MEKLELIRKLIAILGNVSLEEAATWLDVKENAESLLAEIEADQTPDETAD
jgi:hypothetical protein